MLNSLKNKVDKNILELFSKDVVMPELLREVMAYSMNAGGKRLRPILLLAAYNLSPNEIDPMPAALALECVHTSSLIHDDLPCMDDSDLRRGKPTCHKQYTEAMAVLAGDALLITPFNIISKAYMDVPDIGIELVRILSDASGAEALIAGQVQDIYMENQERSIETLDSINKNKTAALLSASLMMGGVLGRLGKEKIDILKMIGEYMGLAFQIVDDILDEESTPEVLGKSSGLDKRNEKFTYLALYGRERAQEQANIYTEKALALCKDLEAKDTFLYDLIEGLASRNK